MFMLYISDHAPAYQSLSDNLFAEIIGVIITVFLVDFFINYGKILKLRYINTFSNEAITFAIRRSMIDIMLLFDYINPRQVKPELFKSAEIHFQRFLRSNTIERKVELVEKFSPHSSAFLDAIENLLRLNYQRISSALKELKPYPHPIILQEVRQHIPYRLGVSVGIPKEMFRMLYHEFPAASREELMTQIQPAVEAVWKNAIRGASKRKGLQSFLFEQFYFLLDLLRKAKKNKLFLTI